MTQDQCAYQTAVTNQFPRYSDVIIDTCHKTENIMLPSHNLIQPQKQQHHKALYGVSNISENILIYWIISFMLPPLAAIKLKISIILITDIYLSIFVRHFKAFSTMRHISWVLQFQMGVSESGTRRVPVPIVGLQTIHFWPNDVHKCNQQQQNTSTEVKPLHHTSFPSGMTIRPFKSAQ